MQAVVSVRGMREGDANEISRGTSGRELMERAAKGIFDAYPFSGRTAIVCGTGNNGGDGYALALLLHAAQIPCELFPVEERFSVAGRFFYDACVRAGIPVTVCDEKTDFSGFAEIVDCIFGTGFQGEAAEPFAGVIRKINRSGSVVISADINSGLCGENGLAALCVTSDLTVSIGTRKPGHFLNQAQDVIGKLVNADIGIPVADEHLHLAEAGDFWTVLRPRRHFSNKGDYGYVTVFGGSPEYAGAAKLANLSASALRSGCGVAQLAVPESIAGAVAPFLLESTLLPVPADETGKMKYCPALLDHLLARQASMAVGMGWGRSPEYEKILSHLLEHGTIPLVIDADGINTLSGMDLTALKRTQCRVVLTPHPKEFERLSGVPVGEILRDPIGYARSFAKEYGVCLLLKGCCTVVSDGEETLLVNRGCAGMATAGSGDVLSGILAGLLGFCREDLLLTVACGAYLAGRAGELAEEKTNAVSMIASDTVGQIGCAVGELLKSFGDGENSGKRFTSGI